MVACFIGTVYIYILVSVEQDLDESLRNGGSDDGKHIRSCMSLLVNVMMVLFM